ncbi:2639_t:CDS:2 [Funneliformis caledonium]|uniref:2639_t:CDS:1 n=1 Tax=Funneliformis caledonium TaxID=1117310 RepID=A0A9N8YPC4_9GLOM|nr:2639_t:CDS:2 [Funneliformis caledonium]
MRKSPISILCPITFEFTEQNELTTKYPKITDKVEPKNEFLKHGDIKSYFKPWTNKYILVRSYENQIILLDSMKKCFTYKMSCGCGIPKVTLVGTLEDWLHLQEKVAKLRGLGLELDFWLDRLEPVVSLFVATYKGNLDVDF